jgi:hypothetical protein
MSAPDLEVGADVGKHFQQRHHMLIANTRNTSGYGQFLIRAVQTRSGLASSHLIDMSRVLEIFDMESTWRNPPIMLKPQLTGE